jgi:predicted site-specific integrase-resolvase
MIALMAKKIIIDPEKEMTQKDYAELKGVKIQTVNSWIKRGKVKFRVIEELNHLILIQLSEDDKKNIDKTLHSN